MRGTSLYRTNHLQTVGTVHSDICCILSGSHYDLKAESTSGLRTSALYLPPMGHQIQLVLYNKAACVIAIVSVSIVGKVYKVHLSYL